MDRICPLPDPTEASRFTYGLLLDAAKLLEHHGYPRPTSGRDLVDLQIALHGFLYDLSAYTPSQ